ncbi:MAG TPA: hypothetical protein VME46_00720 [Acidimicrobiales bacterium]|nr:hypothetical protein [Acidimicrobiales bacterium]
MPGLSVAALVAVSRRPGLWPVALAQWAALTGPRWWSRWPPLPVPPHAYMAWRAEAMYGQAGTAIDGEDLVAYLEWCRRMRTLAR